MSYAIVFSSRTGNTALLAQTLQEQLPQADCCYFGAPDTAALAADTLYVGFWTDKGKADTDTLDFCSSCAASRYSYLAPQALAAVRPTSKRFLPPPGRRWTAATP